jgi:FKBP-type peptidyl-prolyl cis-trans isomerase SlyD
MSTTQVISFHYTLTDPSGKVLDSSRESEPLQFLSGTGAILEHLESALLKMKVGDKQLVNLTAEQGYGIYHEDRVIEVERAQVAHLKELKVGDQLAASGPNGEPVVLTVKTLGFEKVSLDGNHPLAGVDLRFDVEMMETRPATDEEIAHGHAHGPGGHHH